MIAVGMIFFTKYVHVVRELTDQEIW